MKKPGWVKVIDPVSWNVTPKAYNYDWDDDLVPKLMALIMAIPPQKMMAQYQMWQQEHYF